MKTKRRTFLKTGLPGAGGGVTAEIPALSGLKINKLEAPPLNPLLLSTTMSGFGARRALPTMAEIQCAAGASSVQVAHENAPRYASWQAARQGIGALPYEPMLARVASARMMGGCTMAGRDRAGVVDPDGRYRGLAKLSAHDGSLFPTSIGASPQLPAQAA